MRLQILNTSEGLLWSLSLLEKLSTERLGNFSMSTQLQSSSRIQKQALNYIAQTHDAKSS